LGKSTRLVRRRRPDAVLYMAQELSNKTWIGGIDANAEHVRRGMAWVFDRSVKDRSLYRLQNAARADRIGLWADAAPIAPWDWRQAKRQLEYRARKRWGATYPSARPLR
jgi:endonuclease YncB( thermonuclease family)